MLARFSALVVQLFDRVGRLGKASGRRERPRLPAATPLAQRISDRITIGPSAKAGVGKAARRAVAAIDAVHGGPPLPNVPLIEAPLDLQNGTYEGNPDGRPRCITVSTNSQQPTLTTVHEVGHYIDHQAFRTDTSPSNEFASDSHAVFARFRAAVEASEAVKELRKIQAAGCYEIQWTATQVFSVTIEQGALDYLLGYNEAWARAYAQYIALRSEDQELLNQLEAILNSQSYHRWSQWSWDDFLPIAEAIDELMEVQGWLRRHPSP